MNKYLKTDLPITRPINSFTSLLEGDDSGYRNVPTSVLEQSAPDPMVLVTETMTHPLYSRGATPGLCVHYPTGLPGAPDQVIVRAPVAHMLVEADLLLAPYDRRLVVVDGWRPYWVQRELWAYLRRQIMGALGLTSEAMSIYDELNVGIKADDVGSYCAVVENDTFHDVKQKLLTGSEAEELTSAAAQLSKSVDEAATLLLTFRANLGENNLSLQKDAVTAHGNGGSVDLWMIDTKTSRYVNLGVPFDYTARPGYQIASPAVINYFDLENVTPEVYAGEVAADPILRRYLSELGVANVTPEIFREAQYERRLLFQAMEAVGATYFSLSTELGEPWHFNAPNSYGGKQANVAGLEGSGNGCHAILRGKREAVWSNKMGHQLAQAFFPR